MKKITILICFNLLFVSYSFAQGWVNSSFIDGNNVVDVSDIAVDEYKNTYIYGKFKGSVNFNGTNYTSTDVNRYDLFLARYDNNLTPNWFVSLGSDDNDIPGNILVNSNGNLVISGSHRNVINFTETDSLISEGITDNFIAEYTNSGEVTSYKNIGRGSNVQLIKSLDQDKYSNYILSGTFRDSLIIDSDTIIGRSTVFENFIVRLDHYFNIDTVIEVENNNSRTVINSVKAAPDGYYFSGKYQDTIYLDIGTLYNQSGVDDIFIYKTDFDLNGSFLRKAIGNGNDNTGTFVNDTYGNVYLAGYFQSSELTFDSTATIQTNKGLINSGGLDIYLAKYNKNGVLIWARNYGGNGDDWASDIDINNNVLYITGYFSDTIIFREDTLISSGVGDRDILTGTFDLNGNMLLADIIEGDDGNDDAGISLELFDNNALITGFFQSNSITIGDDIYINTTPGVKDVFVAEYSPPLVSFFTNIDKISCSGQSDGELTVTPYFGVAPYTYSWSHNGALTDSTATGLAPATYTVTVTDAVDSTTVVSYDLSEPDAITFNPTITDVITCSYSEEGEIDVSVTGGNGGYAYQWQATDGGYGVALNGEDQAGLAVGTYNLTVTDSKGCIADTTMYITGPEPITFGGSVVTDSSGISPGAIDLSYTGGFGDPTSFTFNWIGPSGPPATHSEDTSNLSPGNYSVTVTDLHACEFDTLFNVANLDTFYTYIVDYKDACLGTINGSATVEFYSPQGHTNITYQWDANAGNQTTAQATNLTPGVYYYVTVTDTENSPNTVLVDSIYIDELTYNFDGSLAGTSTLDCNGDSDGYIDLTVTSPGEKPYNYNWSTGSTLQDLTNIGVGIYSVTVTDKYNCEFSILNYTIDEPTALSATAEIVSTPTCNGDFDGEITVDRSGGTSPYTYQWDDPGFQDTRNADGLDAGFYTVTVSDVNECQATSSINLTEPGPLAISKTVNHEVCNGAGEGSVAITVTGGTSPFTYFWSTTNGSGLVVTDKNQSGLTAGTYYLTITDDNNCSYEDSVVITEPPLLEITGEIKTNVNTCYGESTGSITVTATGGTGTLTYILNPGAIESNTTGVFSALNAGTYSVDVIDDNGCNVTSSTFNITQPDELILTENAVNNAICNGINNGSIDISVSGGTVTTDYSYNWTTVNGSGLLAGTQDQLTVGAGTYDLTVTDDNGCEVTSSYTLTEPDTIVSSITKSDLVCNGDNNGGINLSVAGGVSPYSYLWSTANGSGLVTTDKNQSGLTAAKYYVEITDDNGCVYEDSTEITEPPEIQITDETANDVNTCNGESTGSVSITATGGTGVLTYTLNPGAIATNNTGSFTSLAAGSYSVDVTDENLCSVTSSSLTIAEPEVLVITEEEVSDANCNGIDNGIIDISVSGGTITTDYTYNWTTADGSGIVAGLQDQLTVGAGTYDLTVTDDNGCTVNSSFTLTEPDTIIITKTVYDISCFGGNDGTIIINHTGGVVPFSYYWTTSDGSGLDPVNRNQGGLSEGTYRLEITDALGCVVIDDTQISSPSAIQINSESATDATAQDANDGTITVEASGGTGVLTYTLQPNNTSNQTGVFSTVSPGNYTIDVRDENFCGPVTSNTITVGYPNAIEDIYLNDIFKVYPNPTSNKLNIEIEYENELLIEVISLTGQLVLSKEIRPNGFIKEEFDLSGNPKGIYLVHIFNSNINYKTMVVLQ